MWWAREKTNTHKISRAYFEVRANTVSLSGNGNNRCPPHRSSTSHIAIQGNEFGHAGGRNPLACSASL